MQCFLHQKSPTSILTHRATAGSVLQPCTSVKVTPLTPNPKPHLLPKGAFEIYNFSFAQTCIKYTAACEKRKGPTHLLMTSQPVWMLACLPLNHQPQTFVRFFSISLVWEIANSPGVRCLRSRSSRLGKKRYWGCTTQLDTVEDAGNSSGVYEHPRESTHSSRQQKMRTT